VSNEASKELRRERVTARADWTTSVIEDDKEGHVLVMAKTSSVLEVAAFWGCINGARDVDGSTPTSDLMCAVVSAVLTYFGLVYTSSLVPVFSWAVFDDTLPATAPPSAFISTKTSSRITAWEQKGSRGTPLRGHGAHQVAQPNPYNST
jgi:hypothetical protein